MTTISFQTDLQSNWHAIKLICNQNKYQLNLSTTNFIKIKKCYFLSTEMIYLCYLKSIIFFEIFSTHTKCESMSAASEITVSNYEMLLHLHTDELENVYLNN